MKNFEFNHDNFNQLKNDILEALDSVGNKHGLIIKTGNLTYSEDHITLKLEINRDINPADQFMIDYKHSWLYPYDITKDMYGKTFTGRDGRSYILTGIKQSNRRTNKVLIILDSNTIKEYICQPEFLGICQRPNGIYVNY